MAEKEIILEIKKPEIFILLGILSFFLILNLQVSLSRNISFGDEGFHTRLAQYIYEEKEYPTYIWFEGSKLERDGYARPPLWNLLQASFFVFGSYDTMAKLLTPTIVFVMSIAIFVLVRRLYNEVVAFVASILTITIPSLVTYSVLFYDAMLVTFYSTLFFLTFFISFKENSKKYFWLSAVFLALAFLSKKYGLVLLAFLPLAFAYEYITERKLFNFGMIKKYLIFSLIFLVFVSPFWLRNAYYYHVIDLGKRLQFGEDLSRIDKFKEKYQFAGRVAEVGTEMSVYKMGITNYLSFAYGYIFLVPLTFFAGILRFFLKKDRTELFILVAISLMIPLLHYSSPRAEDAARYMLAFAPLVALISGKYLEEVYQFLRNYHLYLAITLLILIVIFSYLNLQNKLNIMQQVKQFSPAFFEACNWVKRNSEKVPKDALLYTIWSHRSIYACQRNSMGNYPDIALSRDLSYTLEVAKAHGITHLFIQKFSIDPQNRHLQENYDLDWVQFLEDNPQAFVAIYDDKSICILRDPFSGVIIDQRIANNMQEALTLIRNGYYCDGNTIYELNFTI